jgi:biotin transport system substrate-specific component
LIALHAMALNVMERGTMTQQATTSTTLVGALWPSERVNTLLRNVILALVGTALLTVSAKIQVPFWPVPMTMQTFAVLVIGMAYGWRLGAATVLLYLVQGAVGLPVFAAGGGIAYFAGPTGGYLAGFLLAAALVGGLAERGWDRSVLPTVAAMFLGTVVIFCFGVAWLTIFLANAKALSLDAAFAAALANGVTPFLAGAVAKIALAAAVLPFAWSLVKRFR